MNAWTVPLLAIPFAVFAAAAPAVVPHTPAETLSGRKFVFPSAMAGKPVVCVFSFGRDAADAVKIWMNTLARDGIDVWSVANLEKAPGLLRGMIRGAMRKGLTQTMLDRSVVLTKDDKAWRTAMGVDRDDLPVVAVLDTEGRLAWRHAGAFSDAPYRELKARLAAAVPNR